MPDAPFPPAPPEALRALLARASVPPRQLHDPAPDAAALSQAVAAAACAPDHGGLRPWRFLGIRGQARAALGALLAESMLKRDPTAPEARLDLERAKPLRAPLVVAAGAAIRAHPKIPAWEQEASAAAGIMNFLNALDAMGFGCCWLSSPALQDPEIKTALGFAETDRLLGWIYVGTPEAERPRPQRPAPEGFWRDWQPA
ncbi:nitroreductase family protein [Falsiroseomonas tokyonensis]|uniref:Putative NAD(P)H nitroreductase n=1 Tax=Falsiroseomonas tokyonensis TaxID=430521 RepID=A0ABV7C0H7_9PROT|nr:nitroreductase [Falsiroseomonas tokyonensis]MBU8540577.1 nitroreductase [Falsiroseomonas tokyonensis]